MHIHAYTCYIITQTWEVTNRTCSNLSNLYSKFAGFRMFRMFKLQFLQSWRFQNIQQNILWRIVTPWVLRLKFNDPLVCLLYHWLQCPRAGVIASRFTLHWRMNAIVSKCIKMYQIVQRRLLELLRNNLQELVLHRIVVAYSILKRQRWCTKGDPQKTPHKLWHVLARARPDSPMSQSSPWRGESKREQACLVRTKPLRNLCCFMLLALYAMC